MYQNLRPVVVQECVRPHSDSMKVPIFLSDDPVLQTRTWVGRFVAYGRMMPAARTVLPTLPRVAICGPGPDGQWWFQGSRSLAQAVIGELIFHCDGVA